MFNQKVPVYLLALTFRAGFALTNFQFVWLLPEVMVKMLFFLLQEVPLQTALWE
jgi:hypothetical protein